MIIDVPTTLPEQGVLLPTETTLPQEINSPELAIIYYGALIKGHMKRIRQSTWALGPLLWEVREKKLWSYDETFGQSFAVWLSQPEIDLSPSRANDIINWWRYAVPLLSQEGYDPAQLVEHIGEAKLRALVPILRETAVRQQEAFTALSEEAGHEQLPALHQEARRIAQVERAMELVGLAELATVEDFISTIRAHRPEPDPPQITLSIEPRGAGRWAIGATLTHNEMQEVDRRLRPRWQDREGKQVHREWAE